MKKTQMKLAANYYAVSQTQNTNQNNELFNFLYQNLLKLQNSLMCKHGHLNAFVFQERYNLHIPIMLDLLQITL